MAELRKKTDAFGEVKSHVNIPQTRQSNLGALIAGSDSGSDLGHRNFSFPAKAIS